MFYLAIEKYRVHEVAKDFGLPTKTITEILTKYGAAPKNHMQVLTDRELSVIFDRLTQDHPVSDIQVIFQETYQEAKPAPAAASAQQAASAQPPAQAEEKKPAQGQQGKAAAQQGGRPAPAAQGAQGQKGGQNKPAPQQQPQQNQQPVQRPASRVPQKKIVDTRKGGDVNLAKYDERLETLGGQQGERMQRQQRSGREKVQGRNQRRGGPAFSNKRRQDEAEKMRRLQLEIAKKAPVKVQIPDEISVGELASRMKKTGAEVVKALMK
ncbi:translation initiation factor IF-2 N-terminal domain-containing protein, partial [Oscillibacter sp.]|uniref:translation initiation factor IF-2 N-terminal domain-containing protein n=1 Tax=Oscillibacter sp. TaxID=1945593 RepID=UPI0025FD8F53